MPASPRTTTSPAAKPPLFEPPELVLDEASLLASLQLPITAETFSRLITTNFLVAMAARDRKLTRQFFEEILVTTFNLQNRMVRISCLNMMLEHLESGEGFGTTEMKAEVERHMNQAAAHKSTLVQCLKLFSEMRKEEDSVS